MERIRLACVLGVTAFVLAGCGSGDDTAAPPTDTTHGTHTTTETGAETTPAPAAVVTVRVVVRDGGPLGGLARPEVTQDDRVLLVVDADVSGDVHLHGYDLEQPVAPGDPARIRFRATIPGRFEIELHADPEIHVGELTVEP